MNTLRAGIIGFGLIGQKRAKSFGEDVVLAAVCDIDSKRLDAVTMNFPGVTVTGDWHVLVADPAIDVVFIATTHDILPAIIKACIVHKKHVLVEKPAARFSEELEGLEELAEKNNTKVRIGFNHRYHRAFRKAVEIVKDGEIGKIMFIRARYGHGGRIGYNKEWRADPSKSGGGELIDQGSHLIDLSRMFLGEFSDVSGHAANYFWEMPVDDNAFLNLRTADGQTAFLQVSCTEWKNMFSFEIYGTDGKLEVNGLGGSYGTEKLAFYKMLPEMGPPETYIWEYPMQDDSWAFEFAEFLKDIRQNRACTPGLRDAVENLKIINKIYKNSGYDFHA